MNRKTKNRRGFLALGLGGALLGAGACLLLRGAPHAEKPDPRRRNIACVGDSITFGSGVKSTRRADAWPYILDRRLGTEYRVLNYGVSGTTARDAGDFPYRDHGFLSAAKNAGAELILLMLGTNDSKPYNWDAEGYEADIRRLIAELRQHGEKLVLLLPPKAFPSRDGIVAYDIRDEVICGEVLPILRRAAEEYTLPVIDLYAFTQDHPEYFDDGVHPNILGNYAIAEHILQKLTALGLLP